MRYSKEQVIELVGQEMAGRGECAAIDLANAHARDMRHAKDIRDAVAAISSFLTHALLDGQRGSRVAPRLFGTRPNGKSASKAANKSATTGRTA